MNQHGHHIYRDLRWILRLSLFGNLGNFAQIIVLSAICSLWRLVLVNRLEFQTESCSHTQPRGKQTIKIALFAMAEWRRVQFGAINGSQSTMHGNDRLHSRKSHFVAIAYWASKCTVDVLEIAVLWLFFWITPRDPPDQWDKTHYLPHFSLSLSSLGSISMSVPKTAHFDVEVDGRSIGRLNFLLYPNTPRTSTNFASIAEGYTPRYPITNRAKSQTFKQLCYRDTSFHRIIPGFMIQGMLSWLISTSVCY